MVPQIRGRTDIFLFWIINQNFEKMKKQQQQQQQQQKDTIILNMCAINKNHMMYGS